MQANWPTGGAKVVDVDVDVLVVVLVDVVLVVVVVVLVVVVLGAIVVVLVVVVTGSAVVAGEVVLLVSCTVSVRAGGSVAGEIEPASAVQPATTTTHVMNRSTLARAARTGRHPTPAVCQWPSSNLGAIESRRAGEGRYSRSGLSLLPTT